MWLMDANPFESMRIRVPRQGASQIGLHGFHSGDDARGLTTSNIMAPVLVGDTGRILVKPSQHVNVNGGLFWCPCCSPCVAGSNPTTSSCLPIASTFRDWVSVIAGAFDPNDLFEVSYWFTHCFLVS